jgi:hypothetical protein
MRKEPLRRTYMEMLVDTMDKTRLQQALKVATSKNIEHVQTYYEHAAAVFYGFNIEESKDDEHQWYIKHPTMTNDDIGYIVRYLGIDIMLADRFMKNKKVFRFRESLIEKLFQTNVDKIDSYFLRLPFESILISLETPITLRNGITGEEGETFNEIYLTMREKVEHGEPLKELYVITVDNNGEFKHANNHVLAMFQTIGEGDIFAQLKEMDAEDKVYALNQLIISCLLYLNSSKPELNPVIPKRSPYEKLLRSQGRGTSSLEHISVGDSITIDRSWEQTTEREGIKGQNGRITPTWLVRGHFRNQAHGKNHEQRSIKWIEPFVKGDITKQIHTKDYDIK